MAVTNPKNKLYFLVILGEFSINRNANYEKQRHQHPLPGFRSLLINDKLVLQPQHYRPVNQLHILAPIFDLRIIGWQPGPRHVERDSVIVF